MWYISVISHRLSMYEALIPSTIKRKKRVGGRTGHNSGWYATVALGTRINT
jgi:hypothetical protein